MAAFRELDVDKNGYVSYREMLDALTQVSVQLNELFIFVLKRQGFSIPSIGLLSFRQANEWTRVMCKICSRMRTSIATTRSNIERFVNAENEEIFKRQTIK